VEAAIITIDQLPARLPRHCRLMGVDLGTKTIGLALSDIERRIGTPLETIRRTKFQADAARLAKLAAEHKIGALVVGLPLNMDGSEGPRVQSTRAFVRNLLPILRGDTAPAIVYWDERLSTAAVIRSLIEQNASRARRAEVVDRMAAAYILQGALDRLASLAAAGEEQPTDC
jgi:putative Holliday junction resolvase